MDSLVEGNVRMENIKLKKVVEKTQPTSGKSPTPFLRVMCEETFQMLTALLR